MIRTCILRVGCALIIVAGCRQEDPAPTVKELREQAHRNAVELATATRVRSVRPVCGTQARPQAPRRLVLVNTRQCLSCKDLGYFLRKLQTTHASADAPVWLVSPASDTAEVCPYLRKERVRLPVYSLPAASAELVESPSVVLVQLKAAGEVDWFFHAGNGVVLEQRLQSLARPDRRAPPTPSTGEGS